MAKKRTNEDFLIELQKLNPTYDVLSEYVNCDTNVHCYCHIHNTDFYSTPYSLLKGQIGCDFCRREKISIKNRRNKKDFVNKLSQVNINIDVIGDYTNCKNKIECMCKIHNEVFFATPDHLIQGETGCPKCIQQKQHECGLKSQDQFTLQIKNINPHIIVLGEYNGAKEKISVRCAMCGHEWTPVASSLVQGFGCPKCAHKNISERQTKNISAFLYDLQYWNPDILYIDGYTKASSKVHVRCKQCGHEWYPIGTAITGRNPSGCPICCMSHGEKRIHSFLLHHNIYNIPQYAFDDLVGLKNKPLSYDFYVPQYNLLIEYQGEFHDGTVHFQTEEKLKSQKEHDYRKKNYALVHGYNFLEIWYWDYDKVDDILQNTINNLENSVETTVL